MSWFKRSKPSVEPEQGQERTVRTEGLWLKCGGCGQILFRKALDESHDVCTKCSYHFKIDARQRLRYLFDDDWEEHDTDLRSNDPLKFSDSRPYLQRLEEMRRSTGLRDALVSATGRLEGREVHICSQELKFVGGSMGAVVGEKITRAIERCIERHIPLVIVSASGGARMQEGAISLMQMAKIAAALMRLDEARLPYISILTDPTTGGVTASYAMLGDLNIGEPGALIGFAGPRVIEQTIRQKLPEGFQRSEFLLQHGFLDAVVPRPRMKEFVSRSFDFFLGPIPGSGGNEPTSSGS